MPSNAVSLGTRLAGRYRLERRLGDDGGMAHWAAVDELLNRHVEVSTLPADSPRAAAVMAAAKRAARVNDQLFVRILDAGEADGQVWVVSEWVEATSLADLLAAGPLPAREATRIAHGVAEGLAAAHAVGLSHRSLRPEHVLRTATGQVKIVGLEVDAAALASGPPDGDAPALDAAAGGAVLYAGLTARWPLETPTALPLAPRVDDQVWSPRQVRGGVPAVLDEIACCALQVLRRRDSAALSSPAEVAAALHRVRAGGLDETGPLPLPGPGGTDGDEDGPGPFAAGAEPGRAARTARVLAAVVLVLGLGLAAWQLVLAVGSEPARSVTPGRPATASASPSLVTPTGAVLTPVRVVDFDPRPGGSGEENHEDRRLAVDGDPRTAWRTKTYFRDPQMGGLKPGVGLLLDLGERRRVSTITLQLEGRGTTVEIRAGDERSDNIDDYALKNRSEDTGPLVTLSPAAEARYLLVWLTKLPPAESDTRFRGGIAELVVRG